MIDVTFTQGVNTVTVSCNLVYGTRFYHKRLNQVVLETADGSITAYDGGPTVCYGEMIMKGMSYSDGDDLRSWLLNYARFSYNTFTISAITNVDLGKGKNTSITLVSYAGGNVVEGFNYIAPGIYDVNLPYRFKV